MAGLSKKEKSFCAAFVGSGSVELSEERAGIKNGGELLCREDICAEIVRLSEIKSRCVESVVRAGLERLAFGSVSDAVSLAFMENPNIDTLRNMDFFNIAELRRKGKDTEIKFFDRFKALEQLSRLSQGGEGVPFYDALIEGARRLSASNYGD